MKKLLALLLALMMLFSVATVFAGCEDSGKKKSSSSRNDDDDEDEDDEDEDEDEDKDKDEDEDKDKDEDEDKDKDKDEDEDDRDDKDDESEKPAPKPTEGKKPEPEPTEPEEEFLDSPYEEHDGDTDVFICAQVLNGNEYQYLEIAKQKTRQHEGLVYYNFGTGELMLEIVDDTVNLYVPDESGSFVLDTETDDLSKMRVLETVSNLWRMFIDFDGLLGEGIQYKLVGTDSGCSVYEAYSDGSLVRTFYINIETGVTMYVMDQDGNDLMWIEELYLECDLAQFLP